MREAAVRDDRWAPRVCGACGDAPRVLRMSGALGLGGRAWAVERLLRLDAHRLVRRTDARTGGRLVVEGGGEEDR